MSEMTPDEKKLLRSEKQLEALANEVEGLHFWIWRRELQEPLDDGAYIDDDDDPEDGPPPGWKPRELN